MAAPHNVELEAAKFLHKLIQESKDEPRKLATKLYVILQHMRSSGKENSMPYQVISRAMETVINEHGLDIEALTPSRPPLAGGTHIGDSSSTQFAGSSQTAAIAKDSKSGMAENEMANSHASSRPPVGPSGAGHDIYQGSVSHLSAKSLDHESPSSHDTRSANSQSHDRHDAAWEKANQNDSKKANSKRKRADSSSTIEPRVDNSQQLDNSNLSVGKGKLTAPSSLSVRGSEHGQFNMVQGSGQIEHVPSLPNSMRTTNITNSMQRAANSKYREEIEVSSAHSALGLQQGGTRLSPHDILSSRGVWNQSRLGSSLENTQLPRFPSNAGSGNSTTEIFMQQSTASLGSGAPTGASGSYPPVEPGISSPMHFGGASREAFSASPLVEPCSGKATVDSEYWKHGFTKGAVTNYSERTGEAQFFSDNRRELVSSSLSTGKALEHEVGTLNMSANANRIVQSGIPGNNSEMNMLRGGNPRDAGKSPSFQAAGASNMPFKEQHLKQLRAQCLVFLAFRNRMIPKKLHLDIALGNFIPKEDGPSKELIDHKGKELSINDQSNIPEGTMLFGRLNDARETEIVRQGSTSTGLLLEANLLKESKDPNMIQEIAESRAILAMGSQPDSLSARHLAVSYGKDDLEKGQAGIESQAASVIGVSKEMKPEMVSWTGIASHNEAAKGSVPGSMVPQESVPERKDIAPFQSQIPADSNIQRSRHAESHLTSFPSRDHWKPFSGMEAEHQRMEPVKDASVLAKNVSEGSKYMSEDDQTISEIQRRSIPYGFKTVVDDMRRIGSPTVVETDQEEQDNSLCTDLPPAPKYTTSEKWIMEQQKRKLVLEQDWALKQKNTEQRIAACSEKLKANVSSSEDISAKTKSVIELKKLQLLELQRRLRSDILNDFFKPISTEMERLKSVKKNRIGRRSKQIERFEQKMKEERQKRIRERQKEFFSEIEVHKERLDDVFKMKRERWKGFNKYVREFHKRKERIHREKIDRIQREKINLLKINDVEGYLRMVQDAKSDRVKQLLKETEKYLQKLGSKLRDAKAMARHYETDIEEDRAASVFENNEIDVENEDEADQAKHYLESNEKYYLMAHSIKESIMEQPTCLQGGKLREYQMNGLRWLVSLYNNHLNGILADEMGLGKTVQVISLICYLMETKNDRGPFLVVVPSSVLPGWESEINFWAPSINSIVYSGPPEERRRLFKERIVQHKFNVLLTTYEYLMNKHDRPKLSKLQWHYIIIDEGHRIKNASCKLNADLKHYHSSHRLLLTGTPLQNNLEELWALLNFLLPNIFNSSEDFSQWFNKPFESNGDNSADQALLSEEENLLIINRLHQVLRPFVLRRLKHKVESQLPEKIERLVRCEASSYQKLLMKRVEDNLGAIGSSKARTVHNSVMELRNICNHPYLSQLHVEEVHDFVPKHYLPNIVRLCGKLEMLDRLLPKLKATDHRVLFFSTMTRLLDVMEDYLCWKQYRYLRLDGHTSGGDRGALIDQFNQPGSPFFIFLLSIRAGGVGVNLQAADTVIIFDTDWNPQVDLQAQARAHRIGQKKDVLVLRLETVQTVEEQVRAAAEHKLGVANQSITAGFFDNNTSAEDRREYLESLLRECKKEEAAPVLDDDSLNDLIARSESEIDIFEAVDRQRLEEEMAMWKNLLIGHGKNVSEPIPPLPSRLLTDDELKPFYEAIKTYEVSNARVPSNVGEKRKRGGLGGLDTQHYGRGKRAREVRSYEEQWTEEEFEKICQADSPDSPKLKEELVERISPIVASGSIFTAKTELPVPLPAVLPQPPAEPPIQQIKEVTPPAKRGRGRPKRATVEISQPAKVLPAPSELASQSVIVSSFPAAPVPDSLPSSATFQSVTGAIHQFGVYIAPSSESVHPLPSVTPGGESTPTPPSVALQVKGQARKTRGGTEAPRRRGKNQASLPPVVQVFPAPSGAGKGAGIADTIAQRETVSNFPTASCADSTSSSSTLKDMSNEQGKVSHAVLVVPASTESVRTETESEVQPVAHAIPLLPPSTGTVRTESVSEVVSVSHAIPVLPASTETVRTGSGSELRPVSSYPMVPVPDSLPATSVVTGTSGTMQHFGLGSAPSSQPNPPFTYVAIGSQSISPSPPVAKQTKGRGRKPQIGVEAPLRRGRRRGPVAPVAADGLVCEDLKLNEQPQSKPQVSPGRKSIGTRRKRGNEAMEAANVVQVQASEVQTSDDLAGSEAKPTGRSDCFAPNKHPKGFSTESDSSAIASEKTDCQKMDAKSQEVKVISTLETAAAVIDRELQKSKKDESVGRQERNDHILQEAVVSNTAVCECDTKLDTGSLLHVADSRDLGKETSIVKTSMEGTSVVPLSAEPLVDVTCEKPPAPDASVSETAPSISDLGMDKCEDQSGKEDSTEQQIEGPGLDNVVVSKPVETKSLEEKNFSTSSTVETDAPVVDPETDKTEKEVHGEAQEMNDAIFQEAVDSKCEARETETKIKAGSFANVEDLVTENSAVGPSEEGTSAVPPNSDSSDDVPCKRSSAPDASVLALTVDACEDCSGKEDAKEQEMKCSVRDDAVVSEPWEDKSLGKKEFSTVPRLEPASPVDTGIEKTRMEVDAEALGSCDPILQEAVVSNAEACEPETKLNDGPPENVADPRDLVNENSLEETNVDGTSAMALDAEPVDNLLCEEPPAPDALVLESAASVSDISMDCEDQSGKEGGKEQGMKVPVQDGVVVAGPREINNLEGEKFSTSSMSEKEAPVDPEKIETNFDKEAEESNDPSLKEAVISLPEASEPETMINASSFENVAEPTDLVEEKTIVGSKVEGTSEQDLKRLVEDDAVVPETDESKSLDENCVSTFSRLHPTTPVVDTEIGKTVKDVDAEALQSYNSTLQDAVVSEPMACELETKLNASPQNLADSSDFVTENSLLESNAESSPAIILNADPLDDAPYEEPPAPDALVLEPTASASDISMYFEDQSGREDVKEQEEQGMKGPDEGNVVATETRETNNLEGEKFLTLSTSEKAAPVDSEIEKIEKNFDAEAQESSDLILQEALVSTPEVSEPAMKNNTSSLENGADLMDIAKENSIVGTNVEGASAVLDNVEPSDDMPCVEPPPPDVAPLDLITDKGEDHGKEDIKEQKLEGPFLYPAVVPELGVDEIKSLEEKNLTTVSTLEQAAADVEEETEKTGKKVDGEAQESNNSSLLEAVVSKFEGCESETIVEAGCSENAADPIDVAKENIIVETIVEGTSSEGCDPETKLEAGCSENVADPIDAGKENSVVETIVGSTSTNASENVPCEKPPTPEALVLAAADSVPDITMGECEDQSGKEDMVLDKGNVSESAAIENQSDERTSSNFDTASPIVDPPREMPETHLIPGSSENMEGSEPIVEERKDMVLDKGTVSESAAIEAGSSENMEDSEPIVEERKDMVLDTGTVSESAAIENQFEERASSNFDTASPIVDPPCGKPETQLNAGSSEKMGDSEPIVQERKDTVVDKGLVSEPVVTENQSSEEKMSTLETNSLVVDSPHEKPETLLDAGSSENVEDSEPTVGERKDTVVDKGLVSEPVVTENQSLEEKMSTLETNSPVVNQTVEDSEQPGEEKTVMGTNMEVDPGVPPNPISNDDVPQEEPLVSDASLHSSSLGGCSNIPFDSALATEGAKESSSATERKSSQDK